ncbi:ORF 6 [Haloarcula hispanica virus SH1]|uniref:ORF 6 n=1 Tax=Haloarcula hispanica SH1 virus TaxID=326574 RepID=Q4KPI1_9VIRU|nr:ORF 6 [Haloarcula hispanica virus SH1]AAY24932.1 ORF 6 [Haloarcula hispanica virus SH1]
MADDDRLFTGSDDAAQAGPPPGQTTDPLQGSDPVGLKPWLADLTYDEVHAFTVGFAPMFTGLLLLPFVPTVAVVLLGLSAVLTSAAIIEKHRPTRTLRYVVREVHYYLGGQAVAAFLGVGWVGIVAALSHLAGAVL